MTYVVVSICAREVKADNTRASVLILSTEKYAIVTDVALVALLATVSIMATLANNGFSLGNLSSIGSLGIRSVYIIATCSSSILIFDFIHFIVRLSKHLAYMQSVNTDKDQKITELNQKIDRQTKLIEAKEGIHQENVQEIRDLNTSKGNLQTRVQQLEVVEEDLKAKNRVAAETIEELQNKLRYTEELIKQVKKQKEADSAKFDKEVSEKDELLKRLGAELQRVQDSLAAHKKMQDELQKKVQFKNKLIPLSELVKEETDGDLAEKLSIHWLKDAATRIFHNPLRSLLELIANGLDASVPTHKNIGKFGLGAISILGFLDHAETNGCTIRIETTTKNEDSTLTSLKMNLFKNQENYQFLLKDQQAKDETGTCITIKPKEGKFSKETLDALMQYCWALQFYEHGKVEVAYEGKIYSIGEGSQTLVWVTLDQDGLRVKDKGCGMTEEVVCKRLFVPSSSTKNGEKESSADIHLPAFKTYFGKKDALFHFLVSISGVVVIDIPLTHAASHQDLLLKMPASTRLTLARDAIENRFETIRYLKSVIDATVKASITSRENAVLLDGFCKSLKAWEARTPSIAEVHLSVYLHQSVQQFLQANDCIPYPLDKADALGPLLPKNEKLIPFPKDLLFDHFEAFENLLDVCYRAEKKDNLIAGKSVLFVDIDKVTALGLKKWIFAPKIFIESNRNKKSLRMALVTRYADDGKELEIPFKKKVSLMPSSMARMNSPRDFLFITGRETIPFVYKCKEARDPFGHACTYHIHAKPRHDNNSDRAVHGLKSRNNEEVEPWMELSTLHEIFADSEDKPFEEVWNKEQETLSAYFFDKDLTSICREKSDFCFDFDDSLYARENRTKATFGYVKAAPNKIKFFVIRDIDGIIKTIEEKKKSAVAKREYFSLYHWLNDGAIDPYLEPISSSQACKLMFAWLFSQMGVLKKGVKIFTDEHALWPPPEKITLEYLQTCFDLLVKNPKDVGRVITSSHLTIFEEQKEIWLTLEDFMAYKPYGPHAIKQILPLLLLKEEISKADIPEHLHRKFDFFVQQLLSSYRNFLEIKTGNVVHTYGSELRVVPIIDTSHFDSCSVEEIVKLFMSLKEKPLLFEKCLDLYVQEMTERMDLKKRDNALQMNNPLYVDTICCNNGLALLSIAHSIGVDPMFIETVVKHVANPFELYMLCLVILGPYRNYYFKKADPTIALILTEAITIYLRKSKPLQFIKDYQTQYASFESLGGTFEKFGSKLLWPFSNYFFEIVDGKKRNNRAFASQTQTISEPIQQKLEGAHSFTSMQVIHAARKKKGFAAALQKGNLLEAVDIARAQPQESDLQMITQAVEHGSERSCMHATLIEAFQNSVDAIRSFLTTNPDAPAEKASIAFDVRMVGADKPYLLIEVADQIGMQNLKTLLADFLIPNYSEKKGVVGEMGNGSYQMYRDAELVTVKTRTLDHPSHVYFLKIEPMRNPKTKEVVDLKHTCVDITDLEPNFVGTTLNVVMQKNHETKSAVAFEGIIARNFIQETFSLVNPPLGAKHSLNCTLNFPDHKQVLDGLKRKNPFKVDYTTICCYPMQNQDNFGYALTDGYPFKTLEIFLVEEELCPPELAQEVSRGWCLNLPKVSYTPVQSRMRVYMEKETKKVLKAFLLDWIYFRSCYSESSGPKTRYYPHFDSCCAEFYQVYPGVWEKNVPDSVFTKGDFASLEAFFVHYKPSFLQKNFKTYIDEAYENYVKPLLAIRRDFKLEIRRTLTPQNREDMYAKLTLEFKEKCRKQEAYWLAGLKSSNDYEQMFFNQILIPWFKPKTAGFIYSIPSLESYIRENQEIQNTQEVEEKKIKESTIALNPQHITELLKCSKLILSHYCILYAQKNEMKKPPEVGFFYDSEPKPAFYRLSEHKIYVNLVHIPLSSVLGMGSQIAAENPLKNNPVVSTSYINSGYLNHELLHAMRLADCSQNAHEGMEIEGKYMDFEACAAFFAKKAQADGLFMEWAKELKALTFPTDDILAKLLEIEKNCPEVLLQHL